MQWIISKRWIKIPVMVLSSLAAIILTFAWRYRIWSWNDHLMYQEMQRSCHPVWEEFHLGRIRAGADVEEVIARTMPRRVIRFHEFVFLSYGPPSGFEAVSVVAKDGKLVAASASSCCWNRDFFDTLTQQERQTYNAAFDAYLKAKMKANAELEMDGGLLP